MTLWLSNPLGRPHRALSSIFIVWKAVLLLIAILSPGPGYDPSTQQLFTIFQRDSPTPFPQNPSFFTHPVTHIALKLSRWDVIHFLSVARRGYVYEQDWAWGWGWLRLIHWVSLSFSPGPNSSLVLEAMVGIVLVHIAHYASVFVLYHLTLRLTPTTLSSTDKQRIAFTAAFLHTLAPAGLFLSAPYGEALTSFLTFAGTLLYTHDTPLTTILAGTLFALASTVRSNALLNGLFFLHDVLARHLPTLLTTYRRSHTLHPPTLLRLTASLTAGTLLALAFATPQAIAYRTICTPFAPHARQPWCHHFPPSIYTYVQRHYWDVGFLRYWTPGNAPLFALAAPMIALLVASAVATLRAPAPRRAWPSKAAEGGKDGGEDDERRRVARQLKIIAVPQLLLALLAVTSFHVQIITRVATAYPLPYIWLAQRIHGDGSGQAEGAVRVPLTGGKRVRVSRVVVRYMVIYAMVQGALFAGFLPPA